MKVKLKPTNGSDVKGSITFDPKEGGGSYVSVKLKGLPPDEKVSLYFQASDCKTYHVVRGWSGGLVDNTGGEGSLGELLAVLEADEHGEASINARMEPESQIDSSPEEFTTSKSFLPLAVRVIAGSRYQGRWVACGVVRQSSSDE